MRIKYDFDAVDIEIEGIIYAIKGEPQEPDEPREPQEQDEPQKQDEPTDAPTVFTACEIQEEGLYLSFNGVEPDMEIDTEGDLIIEEFEGMPEMYIDSAGDLIVEE